MHTKSPWGLRFCRLKLKIEFQNRATRVRNHDPRANNCHTFHFDFKILIVFILKFEILSRRHQSPIAQSVRVLNSYVIFTRGEQRRTIPGLRPNIQHPLPLPAIAVAPPPGRPCFHVARRRGGRHPLPAAVIRNAWCGCPFIVACRLPSPSLFLSVASFRLPPSLLSPSSSS